MKIITWNINGYRSADKLGSVDELILNNKPDIICLQEIKMNDEVINNYNYNFAIKRGYSGTIIFSKEKPINIITKIGLKRFDEEGRFLLLEYSNFIVINLYIPHGGRQKEKHKYKFSAINKVLNLIKKLNKKVIICTDFNIAHSELDVARYKYNYNNNMFTFKERKMIDKLLNIGFLDSFRAKVKEGNIYSMWPNGFNARERNMGWRIDYIFISKELEKSEYMFVTCSKNDKSIALFDDLSKFNKNMKIIIVANGFDEVAEKLAEKCERGELGGVAFESDNTNRDFKSNIFVTPHNAYYTKESIEKMYDIWTNTILSVVTDETINVVNK